MRNLLICAAVTSMGVGASIGVVQAAPVPTPNGDPFPSGSIAILTGGPYTTPFGTFDQTTVANFDGFVLQTTGGNEYFTYATSSMFGTTGPTQTVTFDNGGVFSTYTFTNGDVEVEIKGRTSTTETGTFDAIMLMATWTGMIDGHTIIAQINPGVPTTGTVTFSEDGNGPELLVDYTFDNQTEFNLDGGPFMSTPLTGVSAAVPEAPAWTMMLMGFAGLGFAGRRVSRKAAFVAE